MTEPFHQPAIVVPVHPCQRSQLHFLPGFPAFSMYHFRLVKPVDAFRHRIVVGVACAARRGQQVRVLQPLRVRQRHVLRALIRVMDGAGGATGPQRLLQRIQHERGFHR